MIDISPLAQIGVRLVRPAMVVGSMPSMGGTSVPPIAKVGIALILAVTLLPAAAEQPISGDRLLFVIVREVVIGLALAMAGNLVLAAAEAAGSLVGFQLGFSYATIVDPQTSARSNVFTGLYGLLATLTFLAVNGHHAVIRALSTSYEVLPIGAGGVSPSLVATVARMFALVLTVGVRLAAPIVVGLFVAEVALGVIARAAPALNLMTVGFTIRSMLGLLIFTYTLGVIPSVMTGVVPTVLELAQRLAMALR